MYLADLQYNYKYSFELRFPATFIYHIFIKFFAPHPSLHLHLGLIIYLNVFIFFLLQNHCMQP